jgi:hypothetical protein
LSFVSKSQFPFISTHLLPYNTKQSTLMFHLMTPFFWLVLFIVSSSASESSGQNIYVEGLH